LLLLFFANKTKRKDDNEDNIAVGCRRQRRWRWRQDERNQQKSVENKRKQVGEDEPTELQVKWRQQQHKNMFEAVSRR
jgi:hypothetical protein